MKKLIIISTLITFTISFNSHGAEQSIKTELKDYAQITESIDNEFNQKKNFNQTLTSISSGLFIKCNQLKLKTIKYDLRKNEKEQIFVLLQDHGMKNEQIKQIFEKLDLVHETRKTHLSQTTYMNASHDQELIDHIKTINKQLIKKKFNSDNINIIIQHNFDGTQADNGQRLDQTYTISKDGLVENYVAQLHPDTIRFNPLYINYKHAKAIALHETEHSIQGHHTIHQILTHIPYYINKICHNVDNPPMSSQKWHRLIQIHEQQADILPAIRDPESAKEIRAFRSTDNHSCLQNINYDHYYQLSEIDEIHTMIANTISFNSHGAKQSIETKLKDASCAQITEKIDDEVNQKKEFDQLIQSMSPGFFIKYNQLKLQTIEYNLRKEEKQHIVVLLQDCGMNEKQIEQILKILQLVYKTREKHLSQTTHMNASHNVELVDQINTINEQLMKEGFNSNNINIIQHNVDGTIAANSQHLDQRYTISNDGLIENYSADLSPDTIRFNPLYVNYKHAKAIVLHETEHSIQGHHTTGEVINNLSYNINKICNNNESHAALSLEYRRLLQLHVQQADILTAIKNPNSAELIRAFRRTDNNPCLQDIYYDHYYQLSEIDEAHKMIAHLKKLKKD